VSLHLGTSGWAYAEWKPAFYPADLPQRLFLSHYAGRLTACEVNGTFYRLQSRATTGRWAAETPAGFRFGVKVHRALTHGVRLDPERGPEGLLARFLDSLEPLGDRLGALLVQLPPTRTRDDRGLDALLDALPAHLPPALEFRHPSWDAPEVVARVVAAGGTLCLSETEGRAPARLPDGPIAYVRLRAERYDEHAREAWRELLAREAAGRPVYAFAKHEGVPAGDPFAGVGLATWLVDRAGASPVS
jgi:uncharacterized protein YecE (DUF72 family)